MVSETISVIFLLAITVVLCAIVWIFMFSGWLHAPELNLHELSLYGVNTCHFNSTLHGKC